jgi:dynein heavy chain
LIADNNRELKALEDKILDRLNNSQQNLLEDSELMNTLNSSKEKSAEVKQTLEQAENVMKRINDAREVYKPCAKKAAILFFVLNDLNKINPMY